MEFRKYAIRIAKTPIGRKVGKMSSRISGFIERANYGDFRTNMQKRLSPVNWFETNESESIQTEREKINSNEKKVKVRIFHQQANMFNSVESVCEAFRKDETVDLLVVLTGARHDLAELKKQMWDKKYNYIEASDYYPNIDKPDIVIIYHQAAWPSIQEHIRDLRKYAKRIVNIPLTVINPFSSTDVYIRNYRQSEIGFDYCLLDSYVCKLSIDNDRNFHNYIEMGNPKFDSIYKMVHGDVEYPKSWKKLEGKKVFLWATDHGYTETGVYEDVAFDLFASPIFNYFQRHEDVALIFRPHATLINEMMRLYWSVSDYDFLVNLFNSSKNMVWDITDNYGYAYSIADAIISDINCDVIGSALVIDKPMAVLKRNDMNVVSYNPFITDKYCNISFENELEMFIDDVRKGIDDGYDNRQALKKQIVSNFDGENGTRIKEYIMDEFHRNMWQ